MAVDRSRGHFFKSLYQAEVEEEADEAGRPVPRQVPAINLICLQSVYEAGVPRSVPGPTESNPCMVTRLVTWCLPAHTWSASKTGTCGSRGYELRWLPPHVACSFCSLLEVWQLTPSGDWRHQLLRKPGSFDHKCSSTCKLHMSCNRR